MTNPTQQPGWNPPGSENTQLFQLAQAVRNLIAEAGAATDESQRDSALSRAQDMAGMLVVEAAEARPSMPSYDRPGDAEAALAVLDQDDLHSAYSQWQGQRHQFVVVDPSADDARAGVMRVACVHWAAFEQQSRTLGELLDRALLSKHAGQERVALDGAKALLVLQYRQAFEFCDAVRRLVVHEHAPATASEPRGG